MVTFTSQDHAYLHLPIKIMLVNSFCCYGYMHQSRSRIFGPVVAIVTFTDQGKACSGVLMLWLHSPVKITHVGPVIAIVTFTDQGKAYSGLLMLWYHSPVKTQPIYIHQSRSCSFSPFVAMVIFASQDYGYLTILLLSLLAPVKTKLI